MKTLKDLLINELYDVYDAEHRLSKAMPALAMAATCNQLSTLIQTHLTQTKGHESKLERVFACFDCKPKRATCEATIGLVAETEQLITVYKGSPVINAAIVAAAQKVEHYEIASYGCLHEWACLLDNVKAAEILALILAEEKAANHALTELARTKCNPEAAQASMDTSVDGLTSAEAKEAKRALELMHT